MTNNISLSAETTTLHALLQAPMDGTVSPDVAEIRRVIADGADLNTPDDEGLTPLIRHLSWVYPVSGNMGDKDAVHAVTRLLLRHGADITATTPEGITAQDLAVKWPDDKWTFNRLDREALRRSDPVLLAEVEEISTLWPQPGTPADDTIRRSFMVACHNGMMDEIRYLLHLYPDAVDWHEDSWTTNGGTGLMSAINHGGHKLNVAELLVARGTNVNWQNDAGLTALHLAVSRDNGSEQFIDLLIKAGASEKIKSQDNHTARTLAAVQTKPVFAETLTVAITARDSLYQAARAAVRESADAIIIGRRQRDGQKFKL